MNRWKSYREHIPIGATNLLIDKPQITKFEYQIQILNI